MKSCPLCGRVELVDPADGKAEVGENALREGAIVLEPIAIGAATDDLIAVAAQLLLQRAAIVRDVLEQDDPVLAGLPNPVEVSAPIRGPRHHAGEDVVAAGLGNENPHLMARIG